MLALGEELIVTQLDDLSPLYWELCLDPGTSLTPQDNPLFRDRASHNTSRGRKTDLFYTHKMEKVNESFSTQPDLKGKQCTRGHMKINVFAFALF